jgi:hypothetical protein
LTGGFGTLPPFFGHFSGPGVVHRRKDGQMGWWGNLALTDRSGYGAATAPLWFCCVASVSLLCPWCVPGVSLVGEVGKRLASRWHQGGLRMRAG